jgi:chitinase
MGFKFLGQSVVVILAFFFFSCSCSPNRPETATSPQASSELTVTAYYTGKPMPLEPATVDQLTHIIYSFLHLDGQKLALDNAQDSLELAYLVSLKERKPDLKVLLSLGGWGGCETCSEVFTTPEGRSEFAGSVKDLLVRFKADGIDLDWEYPAIEGYPGHAFFPGDRENFTQLVQELRNVLGPGYEISFAAGGFTEFLEKSVEWQKVMPLLDRVNIMSYDLVNGNSPLTGHHTPLYSTPDQLESMDRALKYLDDIGIPRQKVVIGAAFYARVWEGVENQNQGLYQTGKFKEAVPYNRLEAYFNENPGFSYHWDAVAQAPYRYNSEKGLFATYDDSLSIALKTRYAIENNLNGIMFWQLSGDKPERGLLEVIDQVKRGGVQ